MSELITVRRSAPRNHPDIPVSMWLRAFNVRVPSRVQASREDAS